jgi:electron transfer flavoprotein alpha subunit
LAVRASGATVSRGDGASLVELEVDGPFVATLQPGARAVGTRDAGPPTTPTHVPAFAAFATAADAEVIEVLPAEATTMDLAEAPFILGAGAGLGTPEDFARLEAVAGALGASTGATRVVTDAGWTTHDRQIGTTGVVVDPDCYVAFGISGAVQHTSGLGDPAHVVSVNVDPHCPMTSLADVAIVADAPAVVAALADRLGVATDTDRNTPGDSQGATP